VFVEGKCEKFVLPVACLGECGGCSDDSLSTFPHAATAVHQKARRHRRVLTGEKVDPLRGSILEDSKSLFRKRRYIGSLAVLDRDVRDDQFSA
jgi:hypothetical protein